MRLWHYKLIPFLPRSQLIAQWRELNSIFKKQDKHLLINYVYEYDKENLWTYSMYILSEIYSRHYKVNLKNFHEYFGKDWQTHMNMIWIGRDNPFPNHHNIRYLLQCFYNLQEKYDRGQKDFSEEQYLKLYEFYYSIMANCLPRDFLNEEEEVIAQKIAWKNWEERYD